jgi:hypothetical protein
MESDGIEEAFEGHLRVLITAAGQLGERMARAREQAQRRAQAVSEQEARELASRLEAEKRAARLELANVYQSSWWDNARPDDVARTYRLATAWEREDTEAGQAASRIRDELRTRYGIDAQNTGAAPDDVDRELRAWADREGHAAGAEHEKRQQEAEAAQLMTLAAREEAAAAHAREAAQYEPDAGDRIGAAAAAERHEARAEAAREQGTDAYDSAERRQATADELRTGGLDPALVETRMTADVSQGRPATDAVKDAGRRGAPKARRRRSPARTAEAPRGNLSR